MIRITRGPEPATLPATRAAEVARVRAALAAGQTLNAALLGDLYASTKAALRAAQHNKCCYCEQFQPTRNRDVEHYRPKTTYWWLTWTWENLMFSCDGCNRWAKNDLFPLWPGTRRLRAEEQPPGPRGHRERPMLLDPSNHADSPMRCIQFRLLRVSGEDRWWAAPREGDRRGAMTIDILNLNRDDLLQARSSYYRMFYQGTIAALREDFQRARTRGAQEREAFRERWRRAVGAHVAPRALFAALNRDILDHHFPYRERDIFALSLPDEL